jgi:bacterioferritin
MKTKTTLKHLQTALAKELSAAHQYQLHAGLLTAWGLDRLATKMNQEMQEELSHSNEFITRILFLKGEPNLVLEKPPVVAQSLAQMLESDLADEKEAITFYASSARQAGENDDIGTRFLFERILMDEEAHMSWLELQLDLLQKIGEAAYITKHMSDPVHSSQNPVHQ